MKLRGSLSVQIAFVMVLALLAAGLVNFGFVFSERARSGLIETSGPTITRFADLARDLENGRSLNEFRFVGPDGRRAPARMGRLGLSDEPRIDARGLERHRRLEQRLLRELEEAGSSITEVRASTRLIAWRNRLPLRGAVEDRSAPTAERRLRELHLAARLPSGQWINADMAIPTPPREDGVRTLFSMLVVSGAVLGAALFIASRLARPLRDLAAAAEQVGSASQPQIVAVQGPSDVRQTIEAFNAMSQRVSDLLTEKDVMLGAIGHDLRTPLTSLRLRVESIEPESEREKAIRTIEETSALLDSILDLARMGRSGEPVELVSLGALVASELDAYAERGATIPGSIRDEVQIACQPILFRRLLRNLLDNGLRHGGGVEVSVRREAHEAVLEISDRGPGMSPETLANALRPFVRGETSRNRASGGAGLGLALADAIARAQGGSVSLANRAPSGLLVTVRLPAAS